MKPHQKYVPQMLVATMLAGLLSSTTAHADYQADVLAQGPVGYWRLNEATVPQAPITTASNLGSLGSAQDAVYDGDQAFFRGDPGALASADTAAQFDGTAQFGLRTLQCSG